VETDARRNLAEVTPGWAGTASIAGIVALAGRGRGDTGHWRPVRTGRTCVDQVERDEGVRARREAREAADHIAWLIACNAEPNVVNAWRRLYADQAIPLLAHATVARPDERDCDLSL